MGEADEDELLYDDVDDDLGVESEQEKASETAAGAVGVPSVAVTAPGGPSSGSVPPAEPDAPTSVYVSGLTWWTTDVEVETYCSEYGTVREVTFFAEKANGKSKGTACVEFATADAAKACHDKLIYKRIHGRDLTVKFVPVAAPKTSTSAPSTSAPSAAKPPDTAWKGPVPGDRYGGGTGNARMMQQQQMMMMQRQQMMMMQQRMMKGGMGGNIRGAGNAGGANAAGAPGGGPGHSGAGAGDGAAKRPRQQ